MHFAQQVISPALSTIEGVAQVLVYGSQKFAVRIQVDPNALSARGIGVNEVQLAVAAANANTPVGTLRNRQQQLTIQAETELGDAAHFRQIIVATRGGTAGPPAGHRDGQGFGGERSGRKLVQRHAAPSSWRCSASRKPTRSRWSTA